MSGVIGWMLAAVSRAPETLWLPDTSRTAGLMIVMVAAFTGWGASAFFRCSDRIVRRYLAIATALMVGWMVMILVKYLADSPIFIELAWYSYYLPMIFLPLLALFGVVRSAALDRLARVRSAEKAAVGASCVLFVLVMTNSLHRWVIRPDPAAADFTVSYSYAPLYWVIVAWILVLLLLAGCVLLVSARRQLHKAIYFLLGLLVMGVALGFLYVQRVQTVFSTNISLVYALLFVLATEMSLRLGLLPSLSWSRAVFTSLPLDLRVISAAGEDRVRTGARPALAVSEIARVSAIAHTGGTAGDVSYQAFDVPGGYGLLTTDVSTVRRQREELEEMQATLRRQNALFERERDIQARLKVLQYERAFLEDVEASLAVTAQEIQRLLASLTGPAQRTPEERAAILEHIKMLVSYSKAKGRLVLAEQEANLLAPDILELLVAQSAADFRSAGMECGVLMELRGEVPARLAALLFDSLFDFTMAARHCPNPAVLIHISDKSCLELRVAHACDGETRKEYRLPPGLEAAVKECRGTAECESGVGARRLTIRVPAAGEAE